MFENIFEDWTPLDQWKGRICLINILCKSAPHCSTQIPPKGGWFVAYEYYVTKVEALSCFWHRFGGLVRRIGGRVSQKGVEWWKGSLITLFSIWDPFHSTFKTLLVIWYFSAFDTLLADSGAHSDHRCWLFLCIIQSRSHCLLFFLLLWHDVTLTLLRLACPSIHRELQTTVLCSQRCAFCTQYGQYRCFNVWKRTWNCFYSKDNHIHWFQFKCLTYSHMWFL